MFFSAVAVDTTLAANTDTIKLEYLAGKRLAETKDGMILKDIEKDAEEATLQWDISNDGKYTLVYYSEGVNDNLNHTSKVTLQFDVGKDKDEQVSPSKVRLKATINASDGTPLNIESYQYHFPYTEAPTVSKGTEFIGELSYETNGNTVAQSANELSVKLGKSLQIRAKIEQGKLKVWTDQINKGYFTDFTLTYGDTPDKSIKSSVMVFPGIVDPKISSTHLNDSIESLNKINAPGGTAGERPGVKVEFNRPKIRRGESFEYISGVDGEKLKATLNLATKLEAEDAQSSNQAQVNFNLGGDMTTDKSSIAITGKVVEGENKYVSFENEKMALYFSNNDIYGGAAKDRVIKWSALDKSMVIGGTIVVAGTIDVEGTNYTVNTGNVALNTGYTFLEYVPEQTSVGETTLQITPYKYKGEITYQVYLVSGDHDSIDKGKSLFGTYKFNYDPNYPNRKLEISVPTANPTTFMIEAILSSESNNATSQIVYYNSDDPNIIIKPYSPQIREVNSIYVIPETHKENSVEAAGFDVVWSAPSQKKLKATMKNNEKIYFELALYSSKKDSKAVVAIFEASLVNDKITIKALDSKYEGIVKYDSDNNQFVATKVVLKDMEKDYWRNIKFNENYESRTDYPYTSTKLVDSSDYNTDLMYNIPNSFYLTMRTVLDPDGSDIALKVGANESEYYPITLDKTTQLVPTPSIFGKELGVDTTDVKLMFNNVSINQYVDYVLSPAKWKLLNANSQAVLPGTYEVILYQDTYLVDKEDMKDENNISDSEMTTLINKSNESNDHDENNNKDDYKVYVVTNRTTSSAIDFKVHDAELNALRKGRIVKFDYQVDNLNGNGDLPLDIKGLDPNQSYYVRVRVRLDSQRTKNSEIENRVDYSLFSKIYGFTTSTTSKPIDPDEEIPPTPKDYKTEAKDNSTAVLNWKDPDITLTNKDQISYEIIRTTEQKLSDELIKQRNLKASDIVSKEQAKKARLLSGYSKISKDEESIYELTDNTLQPNTVYYYYIRTVYKGLYSDWIYQPVTTQNITEPINLKAYNATKTTVDISFLAKAPYNLVPSTYDFEVMIQNGEDSEWRVVPSSNLKRINSTSSIEAEDGYNYFEYRISDLKPGKRYNIKVCMVDKSKDKIDGKYQHSLYSNIVYIRTEYDEEEQQKEDKYEEYLKKFDSEVEKLRRKPYWVIEEDESYKYRADYINSEMTLNKKYELISNPTSSRVTYYLPASVISSMNQNSTMLSIVLENQEINIRPQTVLDENPEIKEAINLMAANKLEDYYVMISVKATSNLSTVNGETTISPKIDIAMSLTYMRQEDILTEADIKEELENLITDERLDFIDELEQKIDRGNLTDNILQELINDSIDRIQSKHSKKVDKIISNEIRKTIDITEIAKSVLIIHKNKESAVNGYYYSSGNWIKVEVFSTEIGTVLEATRLGFYILTGKKPLIDTVPSLAPYQDFINQYRLDEFFVLDSYMIQTAVTKEQVYGSLARVLGVSAGSDYMNYLSNKGIKGISKLGIKNTIRQDEAIYVVMQGYEILRDRKVESIAIRNRQSVQNIGAFQSIYRPYVYAAVELKVIQASNSKVFPSKQMTAQEIIQMLYKIQA